MEQLRPCFQPIREQCRRGALLKAGDICGLCHRGAGDICGFSTGCVGLAWMFQS